MHFLEEKDNNLVFKGVDYSTWAILRTEILQADWQDLAPHIYSQGETIYDSDNTLIAQFSWNDELILNKTFIIHVIFGSEWQLPDYIGYTTFARRFMAELLVALERAPKEITDQIKHNLGMGE